MKAYECKLRICTTIFFLNSLKVALTGRETSAIDRYSAWQWGLEDTILSRTD